MMPESLDICAHCGDPLEEGWFSPGLHSPDHHLRYCCSSHRAAAYRARHPDATTDDLFMETCAEHFRRFDSPPDTSRSWS
jgi:hypothetical protein